MFQIERDDRRRGGGSEHEDLNNIMVKLYMFMIFFKIDKYI